MTCAKTRKGIPMLSYPINIMGYTIRSQITKVIMVANTIAIISG